MPRMTTVDARPAAPPSTGQGAAAPPRARGPFRGFVPGVRSETGVLRSALLDAGTRHEPVAGAVAADLRARGVEVHDQRDLLVELASTADGRRLLIDRVAASTPASPLAAHRLRRMLTELPPAELADALEDGVRVRDRVSGHERTLLPPLDRTRSLRGAAAVIGRRALPALPPGSDPVARRAVALTAMVQRLHPALLSLRPARYRDERDAGSCEGRLDGDDVLIADDGTVLVGIGSRTNADGAGRFARTLLQLGIAPRVAVVALPGGPSPDRLDRLIGLIDTGTAVLHPAALRDDLTAWTVRQGERGRFVTGTPGPFHALLGPVLGVARRIVLSGVPGDAEPADLLPVEPGAVLSSAGARDLIRGLLESADVEVTALAVTGAPAGGVRRLVQPVLRDAVPS